MPSTPQSLKKSLVADGFEVYRTSPSLIILADRVRDNLLMDSGVAVVHGDPLVVRITLRARAAEFPGDGEQTLFERARALAEPMKERGYAEVGCRSGPRDGSGRLDPARSIPGTRSRTSGASARKPTFTQSSVSRFLCAKTAER